MGQWAIDEIGEHGFDDRVPTVGDVGLRGRLGVVGEERMVSPDGEQFIERTRRTTNRAMTGCVVEANAV